MNIFTWEGLTEEQLLLCEEGTQFIYGKDLLSFHQRISSVMNGHKLLFLLCKNNAETTMTYLCALHNDVVVLLLDDGIQEELLTYLRQQYEPDYIVCSRNQERQFAGYEKWHEEHESCFYYKKQEVKHDLHKDLSLLLTTSGSTGSPKLVRLSKDNIMANAESIAQYLHIQPQDIPVTVLPMQYTYGLSIIHSHLIMDATILVTNKTILEKEFWDLVKEQHVTSISGVPYTYEMLKRVGFMQMDGLSIRTLTQAGGKLSEALQEEYGQYAIDHNIEFYVMYGQTEATARMGYLPPKDMLRKIGSMGIAIPGGRFGLIDEHGNEILQPNEIGELTYYGRNVAMGYAESMEDLSKADEWHGELKTGDLACYDEEGFYYIKGRNKRFIKMYGNRISLDEIERMLKNRFELDCAVTGVDNQLRIHYVDKDKDQDKDKDKDQKEFTASDYEQYLWNTANIPAKNMEFITVVSIPRNASGKVIYKEVDKL